jgi:hypothetical protein
MLIWVVNGNNLAGEPWEKLIFSPDLISIANLI